MEKRMAFVINKLNLRLGIQLKKLIKLENKLIINKLNYIKKKVNN